MPVSKESWPVGQQIARGTLAIPETFNPNRLYPAVFFVHGMSTGEKGYIPIAEKLAQSEIIALTINMRGHMNSDGDFNTLTVRDLIDDVIAAYNFLHQLPYVDKTRIMASGASVGGNLICIASEKISLNRIILRAPALYTKSMLDMTLSETMKQQAELFQNIPDKKSSPAIAAISKYKGSVLIISSENDQIIPADIPQAYFDAATAAKQRKLVIIPEAAHALSKPEWKDQFVNLVVQWFS